MVARDYGSRTGSGGPASAQNEAINRRERLRKLALETIDLAKDPYFFKNHVGQYECRLCGTRHPNEGNYLAHTQGKNHQTKLAMRAAREAKLAPVQPQPFKVKKSQVSHRKIVKIGSPGWSLTPQFDAETKQRSLLFEIEFREIEGNVKPKVRVMSAFEQKVEVCDRRYQYILFAAEPYEVIAFQIPNKAIDNSAPRFFSNWNPDTKMFTLQLPFKPQETNMMKQTI